MASDAWVETRALRFHGLGRQEKSRDSWQALADHCAHSPTAALRDVGTTNMPVELIASRTYGTLAVVDQPWLLRLVNRSRALDRESSHRTTTDIHELCRELAERDPRFSIVLWFERAAAMRHNERDNIAYETVPLLLCEPDDELEHALTLPEEVIRIHTGYFWDVYFEIAADDVIELYYDNIYRETLYASSYPSLYMSLAALLHEYDTVPARGMVACAPPPETPDESPSSEHTVLDLKLRLEIWQNIIPLLSGPLGHQQSNDWALTRFDADGNVVMTTRHASDVLF